MTLRPKVFCTKCYEKVPYTLETEMREISVKEVSFSYLDTQAKCIYCATPVYVPAINDKNAYERHKAYYQKLEEIEGETTHGDLRQGSQI